MPTSPDAVQCAEHARGQRAWPAVSLTRRDFLRSIVGLGVGATVAPWLLSTAQAAPQSRPLGQEAALPITLYRWLDTAIAQWSQDSLTPDDDPQARVALRSGEVTPQLGCRTVIPSWDAVTPPGTWVEIQLRARRGQHWTRFYHMMTWDSASADSRRTSFGSQENTDGRVTIDTLVLRSPAEQVQARVLLCSEHPDSLPTLRRLNVCMSASTRGSGCGTSTVPALSDTAILQPPLFSQYDYEEGDGWCSPTALAMVLGHWYYSTGDARLAPYIHRDAVPNLTAPMVYDPNYGGNGNWPFNTAYAAALGLDACVTQFTDVAQVAAWVGAGVPVMCSLAWGPGELDNATGESSDGHLMVVVGVRSDGWVEVADPSGTGANGGIRRAYRADQFTSCWQCNSGGAVYVIAPHGWATPPLGIRDAGSPPPEPANQLFLPSVSRSDPPSPYPAPTEG